MNILKILPSPPSANKNSISQGVLYLKDITFTSEVAAEAYFTTHVYKDFFGKNRKSDKDDNKKLAIVKISANGKSIYRSYRSCTTEGFNKDSVALSPESIRLLTDKNGENPKTVTISKGCRLPFYYNHPDNAIRLSFKLGAISIIMGIVSILISAITGLFSFNACCCF